MQLIDDVRLHVPKKTNGFKVDAGTENGKPQAYLLSVKICQLLINTTAMTTNFRDRKYLKLYYQSVRLLLTVIIFLQ